MNLEELQALRPVNREVVEAHKARMLAEVRAWRLRELREQQELTQVQLADSLAVSHNRVSAIERGQLDKTQIDILRRYVAALGGTLRVEAEFGDTTYRIA